MSDLWTPNNFGMYKHPFISLKRNIVITSPEPPVSYNVQVKVNTLNTPILASAQTVFDVGFEPKTLIPFGTYPAATGVTNNMVLGFGAGTSASSRAAIGLSSNHNVTTSDTNRRHVNDKIFSGTDQSGNLFLEADLTSLDAGGFTLDWSTVGATSRILNYICIGGSTVETKLVQCQMNGTNAAQSFAHGLSGTPTAILLFSAIRTGVPGSTSAVAYSSFGGWAGGNQFNASTFHQDNVTTTSTKRLLSQSHVLSAIDAGGVIRSMAISSVNTTGVNVTYPVTNGNGQYYFWMLCLRGCNAKAGLFGTNGIGVTDPVTISTPGMTPKLFLPIFIVQGSGFQDAVLSSANLSIGAFDGTNTVSCAISDRNGVTTTEARRYQSSNTLIEYTSLGTLLYESTVAFSGQSVVIDPITNTAGAGEFGYLIIGE